MSDAGGANAGFDRRTLFRHAASAGAGLVAGLALPRIAATQASRGRFERGERCAGCTLLDLTPQDLAVVDQEAKRHQRGAADAVLAQLRSLDDVHLGLPVSQLEHMLQTATRAHRANAGDELVLAALCHDVGKSVSFLNHPEVAAALLRPYVAPEVYELVRHHQVFQRRFYRVPEAGAAHEHERFAREPWYGAALRFSEEWDAPAFEPGYATLPLAEFEPLIRDRFGRYPGRLAEAGSDV